MYTATNPRLTAKEHSDGNLDQCTDLDIDISVLRP